MAAADSVFDRVMEVVREREGEESADFAHWMARLWAVKGDRAQSMEWFAETVSRGNRDAWLLRNPELDLIRDHPEYLRLAEELRVDLGRR
jgi:hypothetical protein